MAVNSAGLGMLVGSGNKMDCGGRGGEGEEVSFVVTMAFPSESIDKRIARGLLGAGVSFVTGWVVAFSEKLRCNEGALRRLAR